MFPAPTCSYTTEKLFKDLIYIPKPLYTHGQPDSIPCLYLPYDTRPSKLLLFFHGNAEDVGIAYDILQEIKNSFKVIILI